MTYFRQSLHVRVTGEQKQAIEKIMKKHKVDMSTVLRLMVDYSLDNSVAFENQLDAIVKESKGGKDYWRWLNNAGLCLIYLNKIRIMMCITIVCIRLNVPHGGNKQNSLRIYHFTWVCLVVLSSLSSSHYLAQLF